MEPGYKMYLEKAINNREYIDQCLRERKIGRKTRMICHLAVTSTEARFDVIFKNIDAGLIDQSQGDPEDDLAIHLHILRALETSVRARYRVLQEDHRAKLGIGSSGIDLLDNGMFVHDAIYAKAKIDGMFHDLDRIAVRREDTDLADKWLLLSTEIDAFYKKFLDEKKLGWAKAVKDHPFILEVFLAVSASVIATSIDEIVNEIKELICYISQVF